MAGRIFVWVITFGVMISGWAGMAIPAQAANAPAALRGNFGVDMAACGAKVDVVRITRRRVIARNVLCKLVDFESGERRGQSENYQAHASVCIPEGRSKGQPQDFRLTQRDDGSIRVHWANGVSTPRLLKCP